MYVNLHTTSKRVSYFSIMPRRKSNLNNAHSKDKLHMHVKRPHESEAKITARNSRLCARLASIKEGRPVKIFTQNSVETIVFGNTEMNNDYLDAVLSKLSPLFHRGGQGKEYACTLALGMESC